MQPFHRDQGYGALLIFLEMSIYFFGAKYVMILADHMFSPPDQGYKYPFTVLYLWIYVESI